MNSSDQNHRNQKIFNLTLASVAGLSGCLTLLVVLAAVFGGLWLDSIYGTKPILTLILVIVSIPVSMILMFWVARSATKRIKIQSEKGKHVDREEVVHLGRD